MIPENDKVLLKLHRLYSKDEAVAELFRRISELEFKNGELLSEVAELKHNKKTEKVERVVITKEMKRDEAVQFYRDEFLKVNTKHIEQNRKYNKLVKDYAISQMKLKQLEAKGNG